MFFEDGMSGTLLTDILATQSHRQLTATVYPPDPKQSIITLPFKVCSTFKRTSAFLVLLTKP